MTIILSINTQNLMLNCVAAHCAYLNREFSDGWMDLIKLWLIGIKLVFGGNFIDCC
jgi:hypothetical protein